MNTPPAGAPSLDLSPFWGADLDRLATPISWLWQGYLATGNVTLLTSQWKSGKTTLVSILLSRLREGGVLAGLPVAPGRAAVLSEEPPSHWRQRRQKLDFDHVLFYCQPFRGKPNAAGWQALLDDV